MPRPASINLTSFDKGIINISKTRDLKEAKLPQLSPFNPSDSKVESKLPKLYKAASLENLLHDSLVPKTTDLENLSPTMYQKRLQEAKEEFKQLVDERQKRKGKQTPQEEEQEEALEETIKDLNEVESNQELLWMLRQVVHIA